MYYLYSISNKAVYFCSLTHFERLIMLDQLSYEMRIHVIAVCMALAKGGSINEPVTVKLFDLIDSDPAMCIKVVNVLGDLDIIEPSRPTMVQGGVNTRCLEYNLTTLLTQTGQTVVKNLMSLTLEHKESIEDNDLGFKEIRDNAIHPLTKLLFDVMDKRWRSWSKFKQSHAIWMRRDSTMDALVKGVVADYEKTKRVLLHTQTRWSDLEMILAIGGLEIKTITMELNGIIATADLDEQVIN